MDVSEGTKYRECIARKQVTSGWLIGILKLWSGRGGYIITHGDCYQYLSSQVNELLFATVTLIGVYVAFSCVYGRIWEAFWILLLSTSCTSK